MWTTSNDNLRLALFDRRLRIYEAMHKEIMVTNGSIDDLDKNIQEIIEGLSGYRLLFDKQVAEEIGGIELSLMILSSKIRSYEDGFDIHRYIINSLHEIRDKMASLETILLKHLRFRN